MVGVIGSATRDIPSGFQFCILRLAEQLRQVPDIRRDPPRLVLGEQLGRRSFARGLYDGRDHEREFGRSFSGKVIAVREIVILKFVDRGNEV